MVGVASVSLDVPLFAELYGYGPFIGRRNWGVRDPIHCRVISIKDQFHRNIIVITDICVMDDDAARSARVALASELDTEPEGILISCTHTHSAPTLSPGTGWGERHEGFLQVWHAAVLKAARQAIESEEPCTALKGRAQVTTPLGVNRVVEGGPTDPDIRWICFNRLDGSVKALLHHYGLHAVAFGRRMRQVSADWIGEVNRRIQASRLAEFPIYLCAPAGDINPCTVAGGEAELERIATAYMADLERGLKAGGTTLRLTPIRAALQTFELPTESLEAATMRRYADTMRTNPGNTFKREAEYMADRLMEMAILAERGDSLRVHADLQVLRMGDWLLYAYPGEPFYETAQYVITTAPAMFPMAVALANGDHSYFPTPEIYARYPDSFLSAYAGYGYYEIFMNGDLKPPYKPDIANLLAVLFGGLARSVTTPAGHTA
jgi:hypothetical protein